MTIRKNNFKKSLDFYFTSMYNNKALKSYALVAQLDRVTGYEPVGQGFESLPARQRKAIIAKAMVAFLFFI